MRKGYTDIVTVSQFLGAIENGVTTLIADQQALEATLEDAAEAYIDRESRRSWLAPAITGERYDVKGPEIFLIHAPITGVQRVHVRTVQVGDPGTDLVAGQDYELIDATLGQLRFANVNSDQIDAVGPDDIGAAWIVAEEGEFANALAFVDYTPAGPAVPADIRLAATLIVARSLYQAINPDRWGIDQAKLDTETQIEYSMDGVNIVVPELAHSIISGYRLPVIA